MKIFITSLILSLFLTAFPRPAFAQEQIKNFEVSLTAQKDGTMVIEETIEYDFGEGEKHGIFREIPIVSKVGDLYRILEIKFEKVLRNGMKEQYKDESLAKVAKIRIGDPDKTISGIHSYSIVYTVKNGIGSNYKDHDEIYWNVTGNDWPVSINSASIILKTDFDISPGSTICFTGSSGSTSVDCKVEELQSSKKITATSPLSSYKGLTIVTSFPVNTFPKSVLQKDEPFLDPDLKAFIAVIIPIYGLLNLALAPYLVFWYFQNTRKKKYGPPSVNFDLPKDPKGIRITPAEAGTVDNVRLDKEDIIATIFDLAIRKYLKIEQVKLKKTLGIFGKGEDYRLVKLKDFSDLNNFEKQLIDKVFQNKDNVLLGEIKIKYQDFEKLEEENFKNLVSRGFYTKNPKTQMGALLIFGIILTCFGNFILGPVLIWLSRKLNGRTQMGDESDWKTDGLKIFLKNMSRNYKWQAQNFYTVEKMIPYAMALGFIDEYMQQLKILKPNYHPTWYHGTGNFYSTIPVFNSSFSSSVTTTASSSSSGFSGGSSGGGGGGGGGGSW